MSNLLILDSGHDEYVQGKQSPCGTFKEWFFNNDMQYKIKKRAEDHNILVMLTNPNPAKKDEIGLAKRCEIANNFYKTNGCNTLFISIHSNAYLEKDENGNYINKFNNSRGTETFIASNASQNSKNAANYIQKELMKTMKLLDKNSKDRGVKVEDFAVIHKTIMPCILVEYAFYTNKEDLNILKNNKDELVEATIRGICKYFNIEYKPLQNKPISKPASNKKYKVCIGTYSDLNNANARLEEAKKKGFKDVAIVEM